MQTYRFEMLLLLVAAVIVCQSTGQQLEYLCSSSSSNASNYQVTLLLNIHYGPDCDQSNPRWRSSVLSPELLKWQGKLQTKIGFNIIDTCGDSDVTAKVISEIVPYSWTSVVSSNRVCTFNKYSPINIGFITETLPTGYGTGPRLLGQAEIPLILASDDIINSKSSDQSSVIAVGDELRIKLEMMSKLMVEMEWDFVTVVYSDDAIGRLSLELFQNISLKYYICIDKSVAASYTSTPAVTNTVGVVLLGSESIGLHLLGQLTPSPRVWVTGHDISGLAINDGVKVYSVVGESGSQLVINSLVSFSNALEEAENRPDCSSAGKSQCVSTPQFRTSLKQNLQAQVNLNLNTSINSAGDVQSTRASADTTYRVYFHKESTTQVAEISSNGDVSTIEGFNHESSLCPNDCREQCRQFNDDQYTYIHGQWIIVLFVPIHAKADLNDPWSCVEFSTTRLFRTEAAVYALEYLKGKLDDERFGLLILDSCGYKLKPAGTLYDVIRGTRTICNHLGECFDPKTIVQYVADYSSAVTQQIQTVTRELPAIQMSYGASSVTLNDREDYPYFLRTNPADDLQAHFMVELLKALDKKSTETRINAVNIIYTDGLYGRTGAERVKEALTKAGICVHLDRKVNETASDNNFGALVEDLIYKTSKVKITVLFLDPVHITDLMEMVKSPAYKIVWKNTGLSFILSDTWNNDPALLESYGEFMTGSFSFKFDSDFNSATFDDYLRTVGVPLLTDRNYWLSTLVQEAGRCKIRGNFQSNYTNKCTSSSADLTKFEGESYSSHITKAITSTVYGIRSIANDQPVKFLFDANKIKERYQMMLDIIIPTSLEDKARNHHPFTQEGNGRVGYSIYNLKLDEGHLRPVYRLVQRTGSSHHEKLNGFLKVPQFYVGTASSSDITSTIPKCEITVTAPQGITSPPTEITTKDNANNLNTPLIVVSVLLALLMLAIVITLIILCLWYRKRQQNLRQRKEKLVQKVTSISRRDEHYDEIPYMHYLSQVQRENILRFVATNPGTAPPSQMLNSDYYSTNTETEYHVPQNNRPILDIAKVYNPAFSGSEVSGPSRSTGGESVVSGSTISVTQMSPTVACDTLTKIRLGIPVPAPRGAPGSDNSSTSAGITSAGITKAVSNTTLSSACPFSSGEEEHIL